MHTSADTADAAQRQRENDLLKRIVAMLPVAEALLVVDANGRVQSANEAACKRFAHRGDQLQGLRLADDLLDVSAEDWASRWASLVF